MSDAHQDDRHDRVSRRAYELWEREGGEHGRHEEHWSRAAGEVDDEARVAVAAPDGTTLSVPESTVEGDAAEPPRKRASPKPKAAPKPDADAAPPKAAAKPRKPKAK